jgi:hypothetical protein
MRRINKNVSLPLLEVAQRRLPTYITDYFEGFFAKRFQRIDHKRAENNILRWMTEAVSTGLAFVL